MVVCPILSFPFLSERCDYIGENGARRNARGDEEKEQRRGRSREGGSIGAVNVAIREEGEGSAYSRNEYARKYQHKEEDRRRA